MPLSSKNAPAPEIMNVGQIIEYAFGDFQVTYFYITKSNYFGKYESSLRLPCFRKTL